VKQETSLKQVAVRILFAVCFMLVSCLAYFSYLFSIKCKKVKWSLFLIVQALRHDIQRSEGVAPFSTLALVGHEWSASPLRKKPPVHNWQEGGWIWEPVWILSSTEKYFVPVENGAPTVCPKVRHYIGWTIPPPTSFSTNNMNPSRVKAVINIMLPAGIMDKPKRQHELTWCWYSLH
jgi:hypothetical protein